MRVPSLRFHAGTLILSMAGAIRIVGCSDSPDLLVNNPHDPLSPSFLPAAVTNFRMTNVGDASRVLSWVSQSRYVLAYRIERKLGANGPFSMLARIAPPDTSYIDTTAITSDTTYYYRVVCEAATGNASLGDSIPLRVPFPPPGDLG